MASRVGRRASALLGQTRRHGYGGLSLSGLIGFPNPKRLTQKRVLRTIIIVSLVFIALFPPIFFHFRLKRLHQIQVKGCAWINHPPLVCAHGGDSSNAFPNTMAAYDSAIRSRVDCVEIDVSRSSDGVLFALHDRQGFAAHLW